MTVGAFLWHIPLQIDSLLFGDVLVGSWFDGRVLAPPLDGYM